MHVGLTVLAHSEIQVQRFPYGQVLKRWPGARLIPTDAVSLLRGIETGFEHTGMKKDPQPHGWYDTSNFPTHHPLYGAASKMLIRKM
jgi:hypothetical protein